MSIATLLTQSVSVQTYQGAGAFGPTYADAVTVACFVNDRRQEVRGGDGDELISETTLYAPLDQIDTFTVGSKVTVNGRTAEVISAYRRDSAGPSRIHHAQITLT